MITGVDLGGPDETELLNAIADPKIRKIWLRDIVELSYAYWVNLAQNKLSGDRGSQYKRYMSVEYDGDDSAALVLEGRYPIFIEEGTDKPTDMRRWLLGPNSTGRRKTKDGRAWYNIIPFTHGKSIGAVTKSAQAQFQGKGTSEKRAKDLAQILKQEIQQQLLAGEKKDVPFSKAMKADPKAWPKQYSAASWQQTGKKTKWGARLELTSDYGRNLAFAKSRFQGMVKTIKVYEKKSEQTYTTFRVISSRKGQGVTWMYPATPGVHLMDDVAEYIEQNAQKWLETLITRIG